MKTEVFVSDTCYFASVVNGSGIMDNFNGFVISIKDLIIINKIDNMLGLK